MEEGGYFSELLSHPCYPHNLTKFLRSSDAQVCESNKNLCALKFKIGAPAGGVTLVKNSQKDIHGTLNWFACIDANQCESLDTLKSDIIAKFCSIPSCTIFPAHTSERQLCIVSQVLGCSIRNRFELSSDFELSALCAVYSQEDLDQGAVISAPDASLLKELSEHDLTIESTTMNSLIDCGAAYAYDLPSLTFSGATTSLGSFDACIKHHIALDDKSLSLDNSSAADKNNRAAYKYCLTNYDTMIHSGTCLPHSCDGPKFRNMLAFLCDYLDPVQHQGFYRGSETCLDYIDMIPLNTCLMVQMLGCDKSGATISYGHFDVLSLFESSPEKTFDNRTRQLYDWVELNPTFSRRSWDSALVEYKRLASNLQRQTRRYTAHRSLLAQTSASSAEFASSSSADTIKNFRYESEPFHRMTLRCGGWFDKLDESTFNRTAGWLTAGLIVLLPFYPLRFKRSSSISECLGRFIASWPANLRRNLAMNIGRAYKLGSGDFAHICGMRSINMFWVVLGHTFTFSWQEGVDQHFQKSLSLIHDYKFQVVLSGQLAVDSFFFIAGLMFGLFSATRLEAICQGVQNASFFSSIVSLLGFSLRQCIRRYLRLMTTTAVVLAASYWIIPYLWNGPMWVTYIDYVRYGQAANRDEGCYSHWWKVLLMISNLDTGGLACMGHTWYLANDFQFYVSANLMVMLSTLLASKMMINPRTFLYSMILAVYTVASAYSYKIVYDKNLHFAVPAFSDASLTPAASEGSRDLLQNWAEFYVKPWCRVGPYLIGMVAGMLYRDRIFEKFITTEHGAIRDCQVLIDDASPLIRKAVDENESPMMRRREAQETPRPLHPYQDMSEEPAQPKRPNVQVIYAYTIVAFVLSYLCVVSFPYSANRGNVLTWNPIVDRLCFVFNRSLWALCCAWFALILTYVPLYPKQLKLLTPLRRLLSCKPMALCSIFTFTFYLVHPFVQQIYYAARTTDIGLSNLMGWFATIGHFVVTAAFGVLLCVMVEIPLEYLCRSIGF